ncbi:uncharacterized protein FSUBG_4523 [Fusarium subglutinans]|uniref:Uncharacterized protein n=1 Tax=Gibberella subglutinans TaxID=42677 RepID=A0A8H5Q4E0_GIBSU|nr:uncharacterized protein FSUBG_4523 [Fusarium subglutinans]KAF5608595.1 hypothetical protein FSUBG_4523 [Fusarium subglutinans]
MKISIAPLVLVAALAGFGEAYTCTARFMYCGQALLEAGEPFASSTIMAELNRASNRTYFKEKHISETLFYCRPDSKGKVPEGKIQFYKYCKNGCKSADQYQIIGFNQTCVE